MIPIDDGKVGNALWSFDKDHNHILDANDVVGDIAATIPGGAAHRLAELVVGSQYSVNSKTAFKSIDDFLNVVRTTQAIDQAYETVQWLDSLKSKHINTSGPLNEIEFNAADWQHIVNRLGVAGVGYATQAQQAGRLFQSNISSIPGVKNVDFELVLCGTNSCAHYGYSFFIDSTGTSFGLRNLMTDWAQKMAAVYDFALNDEIECEGSGCPSNDESPRPFYDAAVNGYSVTIKRGLSVAVRDSHDSNGKQSYTLFHNHFEWPDDTANMLPSMSEYLKQQQNPTSVAAK